MKFREFAKRERCILEEEYEEMPDINIFGIKNVMKDDFRDAMERAIFFIEHCKLFFVNKDIILHNAWKASCLTCEECGLSPFWLNIVVDMESERTISVMSDLEYIDGECHRVWYVGTTQEDSICTYDEEEAVKVFDEYCDKLL